MDVTSTLGLSGPPESARKATIDVLRSRDHSSSLSQPFYRDQHLLEIDTQEIFHEEWLIAGMTCGIPTKDNLLTLQTGKSPVLVIRGAEDQVHVFCNVCRHRNPRPCVSEKGKVAKLVCPHHQRTCKLDGRLLLAGTEMGTGSDMREYGLKSIQVETVSGYIFTNLAGNPPAIDDFLATFEHYMEPCDMENAKVAVQTTIREVVNWKLMIKDNRECYYYNGSHPKLLKTLLEWDDVTDLYISQVSKDRVAACISVWDAEKILYIHTSFGLCNRIMRMPLLDGTVLITMDGRQGNKKLMGRTKNLDLGSICILHLSHSQNHRMDDRLTVFIVWPISAQETPVTTKRLAHEDVVEGVDYDTAYPRGVWDTTNDQDRWPAEENQRGTNSNAYQPGPYLKTYEFNVISFLDWYDEHILNNLGEESAHVCKVTGS